jgi:hypothetical protein
MFKKNIVIVSYRETLIPAYTISLKNEREISDLQLITSAIEFFKRLYGLENVEFGDVEAFIEGSDIKVVCPDCNIFLTWSFVSNCKLL